MANTITMPLDFETEKLLNNVVESVCYEAAAAAECIPKSDYNLTEDEVVANFFLGLFPNIDDADDLALEISTYLDDLRVHAKAKGNQNIANFCDYFADNAESLAKELLLAKNSIIQKIKDTADKRMDDIERMYKAYEVEDIVNPEEQIRETRVRFVNGTGVFRLARDININYDYRFERDE